MENQNTLLTEENNSKGQTGFRYFPFYSTKQAVFALALIGLIFYCTSLYNEYALDDSIVIHQNEYVVKGARGIKDILTKDVYDSFYHRMCASDQLQGGRYRPIALISYALEQECIGAYRTGFYERVADMNANGKLDSEKVMYRNDCGKAFETNYEYNNFLDKNNNGTAEENECYSCWDRNKNFINDPSEDLNQDGVFNEIDCQVYGAPLRHFNNIWLYVLACIFVYLLFSKYFFRNNQDLAFLSALLFLMHPVHTEIVANVRGRDDIFSILFIALCFMYAFKFMQNKKNSSLLLSAVFLLLALMSKEYAVALFLLVPLALFVFNGDKIQLKTFLIPCLSFVGISIFLIVCDAQNMYFRLPPLVLFTAGFFAYLLLMLLIGKQARVAKDMSLLMTTLFGAGLVYLVLRLNAVNMAPGVPDTEILNNPYLYANGGEKIATKVFLLLKYLSLLIVPHPLISDYSYATFEYRNLLSWDFLLSLFIFAGLIITGIRLSLKRHVLGFALLSFVLFLLFISNLFLTTGIMMLEGNLFHASVGFVIVMAWLILNGIELLSAQQIKTSRNTLLVLVLVIGFLYGCKTWERNWDWKNDITLFLKDVKNNPNSVLILGNAGARWIDLADTKEITGYTPEGQDSTRFNDYNGTLHISVEELREGGFKNKREAALTKGINYLKRAVQFHPRYVNGYLNLGLAYFKLGDYDKAIYYWKLAEYYYPNNPYLRNYYYVYSNMLKERGSKAFNNNDFEQSRIEYSRWTLITPNDAEAWYNLGGVYFNLKQVDVAKTCWKKALNINPNYTEAKQMLSLPKINGLNYTRSK